MVDPGADVRADVSALDVVVNGRLRGGVHARRRLELSEHAEWDGALAGQPEVLVIHEKANFGKRPSYMMEPLAVSCIWVDDLARIPG